MRIWQRDLLAIMERIGCVYEEMRENQSKIFAKPSLRVIILRFFVQFLKAIASISVKYQVGKTLFM